LLGTCTTVVGFRALQKWLANIEKRTPKVKEKFLVNADVIITCGEFDFTHLTSLKTAVESSSARV